MKTRGISAAAAAVALTWSAFSGAGVGAAAPDPYFPLPPSWCPGNPPGALTASGYGGYCEGNSYPDGTRWNAYSIGLLWQPVRCIIPTGPRFRRWPRPVGAEATGRVESAVGEIRTLFRPLSRDLRLL